MDKLKPIGKWFTQPDVLGQGIAQIPKVGISLVSTELGNKIINTTIGAIGNIVNEKFNKTKHKAMMRSLFTNLMFTFADPTANQMREIKRNWQDLVGGLKMKNFSTAFGALIEEPQEVVGAIRSAIPSMKLKGFKAPSLARLRNLPISADKVIQQVDTSAVSTYRGFGDPLADDDLVDY